MLPEPDRLDEDKEREEGEEEEFQPPEPDYEQIIEDRAYMNGRDPAP